MQLPLFFGFPRKLGIVRIPLDCLVDLLRLDGTRVLKFDGIPLDARIVGIEHDIKTDSILLLLESGNLGEIEPGNNVPEITIRVTEQVLGTFEMVGKSPVETARG